MRRGRPLKPAGALKSNQKKRLLAKLKKYHIKTQAEVQATMEQLSSFEKLPVELLQQIFFYALEVNLPRASNYLGQVLSTESVYKALIALAYFDDDGRSPVLAQHFLPAEYKALDYLEKVSLQQSILSCKWCTYRRIRSCLPILARLVMHQEWYKESQIEQEYSIPVGSKSIVVPDTLVSELAPLPPHDDEAALEKHFLAQGHLHRAGGSSATQFQLDQSDVYQPRVVAWISKLGENGTTIHKTIDYARSPSIIAARHVPSRLLRSKDWSQDHIAFLQLLRQGYTFIQDDHLMDISAKALFEGMARTIDLQSIVALKTLVDIHATLLRSPVSTNMTSTGAQQLTPSTSHPIPNSLFRQVAWLPFSPTTTEIMSILLRGGIDSLNLNDDVVTSWALHGSKQDNKLARWLLKHMEGTENYGLPRRAYLFVEGALSWRVRDQSNFPFPTTTFAEELKYLPGSPAIPAGLNGRICGND